MSSRPFVATSPEILHDCRIFSGRIQMFMDSIYTPDEGVKDRSTPSILNFCLVRPGERGRMPIFDKHMARRGGLIGLGAVPAVDDEGVEDDEVKRSYGTTRWPDLHKMAYARSKSIFDGQGIGEQLFASPGLNNAIALLDDVRTPELMDGAAGISLETSDGNYQHLYFCDRILAPEERGAIQRALFAEAQSRGIGGDVAATGPEQPHRVPGSVNYKPGRGLFVTLLAGSWGRIDGALPLVADDWIQRGQGVPSARAAASGTRGPIPDGHKSDSEADWAWACAYAETRRGMDRDQLIDEIEQGLTARALPRRQADAARYARTTVESLISKSKV